MKHTHTYTVRFSETDHRSRLTPLALYNHFQDTAIQHSNAAGVSGVALHNQGYVWMIHHLYMDIYDYPLQDENIHIQTWANNLTGMYAVREWIARLDDDTEFARGTSRWLLIDINKKKISKLPTFLAENYGVYPDDRAVPLDFQRMQPLENSESQKTFRVRASEIDTNRHANSAAYLDWCLDSVPHKLLDSHLPKSLEIIYRHESTLGEEVLVRTLEKPTENGTIDFDHTLTRDSDGQLLTTARTTWKSTKINQ